ncbi:hypothetical protein HMPREF2531_03960 [Bacteroides intestinalis]|uniref:Uncharacterized protein n=1 Tax=Bacteroides intestinalis TaxID=329854 RepID=A0A139KYH2_9BACE|nr:hypothetical protein HMPREF2531_03960 [Bacteroides intestinalis]
MSTFSHDIFAKQLRVRTFFRDTGVVKYLPVKLCNAIIFNNLCCIHFISELPTIAEKEAVKHLCGASGAKSYKRVIKED